MVDIVVKCVDSIFFCSEKSLGRHHISQSYFENLTPSIIIFTIVCIHHAIGEWKSGIWKVERFDFVSVNCMVVFLFHSVINSHER